ncbi:uncharacterized protein LOC142052241 [Phalacrocorax aristotelis]|uniref:uncharacterized protein LOC142052241 n=1 Tax=Phalacrocorax aristotelis TaxID=126867 RepID=UPI003F4B317D
MLGKHSRLVSQEHPLARSPRSQPGPAAAPAAPVLSPTRPQPPLPGGAPGPAASRRTVTAGPAGRCCTRLPTARAGPNAPRPPLQPPAPRRTGGPRRSGGLGERGGRAGGREGGPAAGLPQAGGGRGGGAAGATHPHPGRRGWWRRAASWGAARPPLPSRQRGDRARSTRRRLRLLLLLLLLLLPPTGVPPPPPPPRAGGQPAARSMLGSRGWPRRRLTDRGPTAAPPAASSPGPGSSPLPAPRRRQRRHSALGAGPGGREDPSGGTRGAGCAGLPGGTGTGPPRPRNPRPGARRGSVLFSSAEPFRDSLVSRPSKGGLRNSLTLLISQRSSSAQQFSDLGLASRQPYSKQKIWELLGLLGAWTSLGMLAGASLCASFLTPPWRTTCPSAFFGTNTCSQCGQTDYTQYGLFFMLITQTSFQPVIRLKLIFLFSTTLLQRKVEILPLTVTGVRLEHYSLDKVPFLTQVLEVKLNNKDCVCSETNHGSSLYRNCSVTQASYIRNALRIRGNF